MADVNRGNRPISPHLTVWRPHLSMILSALHRITGASLILGMVLLVWWLLAAATGPAAFARADWVLTSWLGVLVLAGSALALWFHACNGLRHLWWDTGRGFDLPSVRQSGIVAIAAAVLLTVLTLLIAFTSGGGS